MNWAKGRKTKGRGTSFKGALNYVLHDQDAATTHRVGLVELCNLATDDPNRSWREMMALCDAADDLKQRAGIPATGQKLGKPVYAFTLNWHEQDQPTSRHMRDTALSALRDLGLDHHQAVIVEHTDRPHRHVHVIVNLVDPATGMAAKLSHDHHRLDRWADNYEVTMGVIRSPARRAKFHALDNGLKPPKRPAQATSREEWQARKARGAKAKEQANAIKAAHAAYVAQLKATQNNAHVVRQAEATKLWNTYRADRKAIRDRYRPFIDAIWKSKRRAPPHPYTEQALRDIQESAAWKDLGRRQWKARRAFTARERSALGVIANAVRLHFSRGEASGWDFVKLMVSRKGRVAEFNRMQERQKQALRQKQVQTRKVRANTLKAAQRVELEKLAVQFQERRTEMRDRHAAQIVEQKAKWRQLSTERKKVWTDYRKTFDIPEREQQADDRSNHVRNFNDAARGKTRPSDRPEDQRSPAVRDFNDAAEGRQAEPRRASDDSLSGEFRNAAEPTQAAEPTKAGDTGGPAEQPQHQEAEKGWRARRSATERKADGSYRPRDRDPGRGRSRRGRD